MDEWLNPRQILERHIYYHFDNLEEADKWLYGLVMNGEVEVRHPKWGIFGPMRLKRE